MRDMWVLDSFTVAPLAQQKKKEVRRDNGSGLTEGLNWSILLPITSMNIATLFLTNKHRTQINVYWYLGNTYIWDNIDLAKVRQYVTCYYHNSIQSLRNWNKGVHNLFFTFLVFLIWPHSTNLMYYAQGKA